MCIFTRKGISILLISAIFLRRNDLHHSSCSDHYFSQLKRSPQPLGSLQTRHLISTCIYLLSVNQLSTTLAQSFISSLQYFWYALSTRSNSYVHSEFLEAAQWRVSGPCLYDCLLIPHIHIQLRSISWNGSDVGVSNAEFGSCDVNTYFKIFIHGPHQKLIVLIPITFNNYRIRLIKGLLNSSWLFFKSNFLSTAFSPPLGDLEMSLYSDRAFTCRNWKLNPSGCSHGSTNCRYSHRDTGVMSPPMNVICQSWKAGCCYENQDECLYSHGDLKSSHIQQSGALFLGMLLITHACMRGN